MNTYVFSNQLLTFSAGDYYERMDTNVRMSKRVMLRCTRMAVSRRTHTNMYSRSFLFFLFHNHSLIFKAGCYHKKSSRERMRRRRNASIILTSNSDYSASVFHNLFHSLSFGLLLSEPVLFYSPPYLRFMCVCFFSSSKMKQKKKKPQPSAACRECFSSKRFFIHTLSCAKICCGVEIRRREEKTNCPFM